MTAGAKGEGVVLACVSCLQQSAVFPDEHGLLRRIAWVESRDGEDAATYRAGYSGGIWQVDSAGFADTQALSSHPGLRKSHDGIRQKLAIDWKDASWADCRKPLYSALAARLLLSTKQAAIPDSLQQQAEYWKQHYNKTGKGTAHKFVDDCTKAGI